MGRKKKSTNAPKKTRLELRLDEELVEKVREITQEAGISVNQFMQSVTHWAASNAHVGKPVRVDADDDGDIFHYQTLPLPEYIWFGHKMPFSVYDKDHEGVVECEPIVYFELDYSPGRTIVLGR